MSKLFWKETDQASSPEELPGRLSEEDEGKHEEDPSNPICYLRQESFATEVMAGRVCPRFIDFQFCIFFYFFFLHLQDVITHQVGGYASVCVTQVEGVRFIAFLKEDLINKSQRQY